MMTNGVADREDDDDGDDTINYGSDGGDSDVFLMMVMTKLIMVVRVMIVM